MSRLYLVTGFLGAGKTTFLKNFLKMFSEKKVHVIVNEFGKEGIDGELLREVGAVLNEINNGSIFCSCRLDKFEEVLGEVLHTKPDIIVVEASGLSDPTNVKKILGQKDKFQNVDYMGSICLVDAVHFLKVYETAAVIKKQLHVSDMILLNKRDMVSQEQADEVRDKVRMHRPDIPIYATVHGRIQKGWMEKLEHISQEENGEVLQSADITLRKCLLYVKEDTALDILENFMKMIMDNTFRIKGFVRIQKEWYLISCVGNIFHAEKCTEKQEKEANILVVLSGYGLPVKKSMKRAMEWYPDVIEKVEYGS
ncbi:G3E family GTPase [Muricomes intestini]|jgi:G3E family GTPase|uniref:G3E family GTPase n=1 Tax=Muricomes intestini TaxID=1796634 RepID=A0A4R3K640_9FIRM|nr:GTP-binding protein [Muricomes intestini]TCS78306.1 G3E family GTPase [Muricomes intestini]HAX51049.1 cobalamin biosynthesis protein CobW [Lachnospiraceae bacterium]